MSEIKGLVHVGVASADGLQTAKFFSENFGGEVLFRDEFPEQGQISTMVQVGPCALEIMEPLGDQGVVSKYLEKKGPGLHHISIQVTGIKELADELEAKGIQLIGKQFEDPAVHYMFISPKSTGGILIEIVEHFEA